LLARHAGTGADRTVGLGRRGALPDVGAEVVADLVTRGYVAEAASARQWVLSRAARGYGAARLRAELRARGVAGPLIDAALSAIDRGGQLDEARRLARRRLPALTRAAPANAAVRLRDYLLRRGLPVRA